jgi:hypothetical protein
MIDDAENKFSGDTVAEWLESLPYELENDAIGLWTMIPAGRYDLGLAGDDLIEFTRRAWLTRCPKRMGARRGLWRHA